MLTLFHHPFCPHSRFIRISLGEFGEDVKLVEERVWERRESFLTLNPAGTTPVLVEDSGLAIPGASVIAEYLNETRANNSQNHHFLGRDAASSVEIRRLLSWFNEKFFAEVSGPLLNERFYKRHLPLSAGGGAPDTDAMRAARSNIRYHLAYIGWLVSQRAYLAGEQLTFADLAAAAHLSTVDYLGDVPWNEDETAKTWYARVKSRPSFRPILLEVAAGMAPSATYADLDF